MYEALFSLVKSLTLPPPLHPLALFVDPSAQPVAKVKIYKLPTTSSKAMQLEQKIQNKTFQTNTFSLSTLCHHFASNSASAVSFSPPLASIFCRAYHFQFGKLCFFCKIAMRCTHPSNIIHPISTTQHLPTTCQWPASSLACCASLASLTSIQFISVEK